MNLIRIIIMTILLSTSTITQAEVVEINQATATELATHLKGIGETKAKAIIDYRKKHGPFKSHDELLNVKGIGEKTLQANRKNIIIGSKKK